MQKDVIVRLKDFKRDRQGNWIHPAYGFVVSYDKMIKLAKDAEINYYNMDVNEDYLILSILNNSIIFMHYDRFINVKFIEKEEEPNDRIGNEVQE